MSKINIKFGLATKNLKSIVDASSKSLRGSKDGGDNPMIFDTENEAALWAWNNSTGSRSTDMFFVTSVKSLRAPNGKLGFLTASDSSVPVTNIIQDNNLVSEKEFLIRTEFITEFAFDSFMQNNNMSL